MSESTDRNGYLPFRSLSFSFLCVTGRAGVGGRTEGWAWTQFSATARQHSLLFLLNKVKRVGTVGKHVHECITTLPESPWPEVTLVNKVKRVGTVGKHVHECITTTQE